MLEKRTTLNKLLHNIGFDAYQGKNTSKNNWQKLIDDKGRKKYQK